MSRVSYDSFRSNNQESEGLENEESDKAPSSPSSTETDVTYVYLVPGGLESSSGTSIDFLSNPNASSKLNSQKKSNEPDQPESTEDIDASDEDIKLIKKKGRKETSKSNDVPESAGRRLQRKQNTPKKHVLKEIIELQNTTDLLIPRAPFQRLVREIMLQPSDNTVTRITRGALEALQESSETFLVQFLGDSYACSLHRNRVTLNVSDIRIFKYLRGLD